MRTAGDQAKRRKRSNAAPSGSADQTIDLTEESSDVEVCGLDDDVIVVKESVKRRQQQEQQGQALTVIVHENGRGEPVKCFSRQSPVKKRLPAVPVPVVKPASPPKKVLKCPVCLESMVAQDKRLASTRCGHIFCETCLTDSLKVQKQCPACRTKLTGKTAHHPIFL